MTSPLPELSLCIPTKRQEQNELEDGKDCKGVAPVGLECLLRTTRVCSGKDQALVILMKEEQWGEPRQAGDSAENEKQQNEHLIVENLALHTWKRCRQTWCAFSQDKYPGASETRVLSNTWLAADASHTQIQGTKNVCHPYLLQARNHTALLAEPVQLGCSSRPRHLLSNAAM